MRILMPVDGSVFSQKAIEFVVGRQKKMSESLDVELLHVVEEFPVGMISRFELDNYMDVHSREVFETLRPLYENTALHVTEEVRDGHAGHIICEESSDFGADLIVMGCRGLSFIHGYFLGSVSRRVLGQTQLPVILIGDDEIKTQDPFRVGLAVDASEYGPAIVKTMGDLKAFLGKRFELSVLHVVEAMPNLFAKKSVTQEAIRMAELLTPYYERKQAQEFEENTKPLWSMLEEAGLSAKPVCLTGQYSREIVEYAKKNLDMLVMGSHGTGHFMSAVLGTTALHIASELHLPMMVVQAMTDVD